MRVPRKLGVLNTRSGKRLQGFLHYAIPAVETTGLRMAFNLSLILQRFVKDYQYTYNMRPSALANTFCTLMHCLLLRHTAYMECQNGYYLLMALS
jgi:hypothetical protein